MRHLISLVVILICANTVAQEPDAPDPITAGNIRQFSSSIQIDFESVAWLDIPAADNSTPATPAEVEIGWFAYSVESGRFLLVDNQNHLRILNEEGENTLVVTDVDVVDAVPLRDDYFALLAITSDGFAVSYDNYDPDNRTAHHIRVATSAIPTAIWVTCEDHSGAQASRCQASVEASNDNESVIYRMPAFEPQSGSIQETFLNEPDLTQDAYVPAEDASAVVRIGRIPLPNVVTSSLAGNVKLWDLDAGQALHEVSNEVDEPSVFGNINDSATHLVWRDNANQTLYLLDFISGENETVAPLDGQYAQWFFLSDDASVIVAVSLGGEPNVVTWNSMTGERIDLGDYRECGRPQPDMVRLVADSTKLIIGCDSGLDIWQINGEGQE